MSCRELRIHRVGSGQYWAGKEQPGAASTGGLSQESYLAFEVCQQAGPQGFCGGGGWLVFF